MATRRKPTPKIVGRIGLKENDIGFDSNGLIVIKNPVIRRLIQDRWRTSGVLPVLNLSCPPRPSPPPPPDAMCVCAFTFIGQEAIQSRVVLPPSRRIPVGQLGAGQLRTGPRRGPGRTPLR